MSNPLPLMSKGEKKKWASKRKQRLLPSMPKGETVGNIVINGNKAIRQ